MLHAEISGSGPVIVMLHGYLASSQYYKKIARRLSRSHTVVRVDLLGHGRSPKPRHSRYDYDDHIDALHATLTELGLSRPIVLVGHSMGGLIALRYAKKFPHDVSRLVMFNPPMFASADEAQRDIAASGQRYRALLFSRFRGALWRAFKVVPRSPHRFRPAVSLSDVLAVPRQAREGSLHHVVMPGNVFADVDAVHTPTMIVVGQRDRRTYLKNAMRHTWPSHVTLKVNPHGHNGIAYRPTLAEHYIRSHLDGHARR